MTHTDPATAVIAAAQDAGWKRVRPTVIESPAGDRLRVQNSTEHPGYALVADPATVHIIAPDAAPTVFHTGHVLALTRTGPAGHYVHPSCTADGWAGGHYSGDMGAAEHCARAEYAAHVRHELTGAA